MTATRPIEVAIVGGGCAGVTAAWELTRPEHAGKYRVTIYQLGWRLGGKGASGRGPGGRIEEHGLHFWMGFYENAFRLMRECYAELGRDPATCPIADWRDAFAPAPCVGVTERAGNVWEPWIGEFGRADGFPGDPDPPGVRWTVRDYVQRLTGLARILLASLADRGPGGGASTSGASEPTDVMARVTGMLRYGEMATLAAMIEGVALLETMMGSLARYPENLVLRFLDALASNARRQLQARTAGDVAARRLWTIVDITLATLRGILRFGLLTDPRGFDAIDEYDCREWLVLNGATQESVDGAYMRGLYDLVFAYEDGDVSRPRISATHALRNWLRAFLGYRGSFFWTMQAGMGDVVFAPFYEVLARRGVHFEFFHRLENVRLGPPGAPPHVAALEFDVQAEVRGGREYRPLVDVGGLPCWPAAPDYGQLVGGEALRREGRELESHWDRRKAGTRTLRVGSDFDLAVLAVGVGAIPHVCREIVARDPRWRAMVDHVKTVATQAFQVWLDADLASLGWPHDTVAVSAFVAPFQTWADMAQVIPREGAARPPQGLVYFCGVLPDEPGAPNADYVAAQYERVRRNAITALERDIVQLWPAAGDTAGRFRWELLADVRGTTGAAGDAAGAARFASQYWRANVSPTERYTLSLPGSSAYRISPLDETYDNLTVAGDWTACGLDAGCVEAAVMSGRLAAHAISRSPALEDIVGFDHP